MDELIHKGEVRNIAKAEATFVKTMHHNAKNLNNKVTLITHDGKSLAKLNRKARQKANKVMGKQLAMQQDKQGFYLGRLFYAILINDAIPYNTKAGTEYLLSKGAEVLIEVTKGGFRAYNTKGLVYYSLTSVKSALHSFRLERHEFKMSNKPVVFSQKGKGLTHEAGFYSTQGNIMNGFRVPLQYL